MFTNEFRHTIDTKGRLIVPMMYREELGEKFFITRGLDGCLFVFPEKEWNEFEGKLRQLPVTFNKDARKFVRFFTTGATPGQLDKQGRVLIPATLREFAGIGKEVVVAGNLDKLEIWSKERWDETNSYEDIDNAAMNLQELGLNF